ncbi:ribbon-helix-helix domain-containing protein [Paraburkholderia bonniea]|uniref:ribbon-helix-helix domain-containing protein n=1 Tax=Paraburkholderia bonniea TaxID=2152891 RepID=UPI001580C233|nr:ribbon-helix-helix domain-containing protein [Paraburkholderia bonniea]WJF88909.1 ribbon-helix-helix domain-containing protein [Paraburkholderia bonniea]WJF92225.1 ribbon-helix-helix domain-containing protein [Paraburkholderia bonniea]
MKPVSRSVRVNGLNTCFRLEKIYWDIIYEIAETEKVSIGTLISKIDITMRLKENDIPNFSGFLRVMATHYCRDIKPSAYKVIS